MGTDTPLLLILTYIVHDKRATCEIERWRHTLRAASRTVQSVFAQGTAEKLTYQGSETMYAPVQIESISLRVWWSGGGIKNPSSVIWELDIDT